LAPGQLVKPSDETKIVVIWRLKLNLNIVKDNKKKRNITRNNPKPLFYQFERDNIDKLFKLTHLNV